MIQPGHSADCQSSFLGDVACVSVHRRYIIASETRAAWTAASHRKERSQVKAYFRITLAGVWTGVFGFERAIAYALNK